MAATTQYLVTTPASMAPDRLERLINRELWASARGRAITVATKQLISDHRQDFDKYVAQQLDSIQMDHATVEGYHTPTKKL